MFVAATFLYTKCPPIHPTKVAAKRTYFFNHYTILFQWICIHRPRQTQNK